MFDLTLFRRMNKILFFCDMRTLHTRLCAMRKRNENPRTPLAHVHTPMLTNTNDIPSLFPSPPLFPALPPSSLFPLLPSQFESTLVLAPKPVSLVFTSAVLSPCVQETSFSPPTSFPPTRCDTLFGCGLCCSVFRHSPTLTTRPT